MRAAPDNESPPPEPKKLIECMRHHPLIEYRSSRPREVSNIDSCDEKNSRAAASGDIRTEIEPACTTHTTLPHTTTPACPNFSSPRGEFYASRDPANSPRLDCDEFPHRQLLELRQQIDLRNARAEASTSSPQVESTLPTTAPTSASPTTLAAISNLGSHSPEPEPPPAAFVPVDTDTNRLDFERGAATEREAAETVNLTPPSARIKRNELDKLDEPADGNDNSYDGDEYDARSSNGYGYEQEARVGIIHLGGDPPYPASHIVLSLTVPSIFASLMGPIRRAFRFLFVSLSSCVTRIYEQAAAACAMKIPERSARPPSLRSTPCYLYSTIRVPPPLLFILFLPQNVPRTLVC
jgi:hypothetical protein